MIDIITTVPEIPVEILEQSFDDDDDDDIIKYLSTDEEPECEITESIASVDDGSGSLQEEFHEDEHVWSSDQYQIRGSSSDRSRELSSMTRSNDVGDGNTSSLETRSSDGQLRINLNSKNSTTSGGVLMFSNSDPSPNEDDDDLSRRRSLDVDLDYSSRIVKTQPTIPLLSFDQIQRQDFNNDPGGPRQNQSDDSDVLPIDEGSPRQVSLDDSEPSAGIHFPVNYEFGVEIHSNSGTNAEQVSESLLPALPQSKIVENIRPNSPNRSQIPKLIALTQPQPVPSSPQHAELIDRRGLNTPRAATMNPALTARDTPSSQEPPLQKSRRENEQKKSEKIPRRPESCRQDESESTPDVRYPGWASPISLKSAATPNRSLKLSTMLRSSPSQSHTNQTMTSTNLLKLIEFVLDACLAGSVARKSKRRSPRPPTDLRSFTVALIKEQRGLDGIVLAKWQQLNNSIKLYRGSNPFVELFGDLLEDGSRLHLELVLRIRQIVGRCRVGATIALQDSVYICFDRAKDATQQLFADFQSSPAYAATMDTIEKYTRPWTTIFQDQHAQVDIPKQAQVLTPRKNINIVRDSNGFFHNLNTDHIRLIW